jgi:hypothetical protein
MNITDEMVAEAWDAFLDTDGLSPTAHDMRRALTAVAAAEREACAKIAEKAERKHWADNYREGFNMPFFAPIAAAIRDRKD